MRKISHVVFDCDGVLVDSEYLSAQVLVETFAEIGVNIDLPFVYTHFLASDAASLMTGSIVLADGGYCCW